MNRFEYFLSIVLLFAFLSGLATLGFVSKGGRVWCDSQSSGIALTKGGYRSWMVRYSNGEEFYQLADGRIVLEKNHWCWPNFRHVDLRPYHEDEVGWGALVESNSPAITAP